MSALDRVAICTRMVGACLLIVMLALTLQIPNAALAAYMVFFVTRNERAATMANGLGLLVAITLGIGLTLLALLFTIDAPPLRLTLMTLTFALGMYLSRVLAAGALGFGLGFILLITQSTVDLYPDAERLVRDTLWTWSALCMAIVIVLLAHGLGLRQGQGPGPATQQPRAAVAPLAHRSHLQFSLKTTFAAMLCYLMYSGLDWPGIHTCVVTCAVLAQGSTEATLHKAALRLAGALAGGALALLATVYIVPQLDSLGGLLLTILPVVAVSAWIATGSARHAYLGWQLAFAFFLCLLHGQGPNTDITLVRDRLVGIVLGNIAIGLIFAYVWPEHAEQK